MTWQHLPPNPAPHPAAARVARPKAGTDEGLKHYRSDALAESRNGMPGSIWRAPEVRV